MENPDSVRWLTYDEAAGLLGIKSDSVRRRASAKKWARRLGNDGLSRVGIPQSIIPDQDPKPGPDITLALPPDNPDLSALRAELAASREEAMELRRQLAEAREHGARLEGEASASAARLTDVQADRDHWRTMAEKLASEPRPRGWIDRLLGR